MSTPPITKAVILAAGLGNRLRKLGTGTPKPFVPIDRDNRDFTFIDLHIHNLTQIGVKEIYLVGNQTTFGREFSHDPEVSVTWVLNPTDDLASSGSGHSAWFAWTSDHQILDGKARVILMDADIAYTPSILELLANNCSDRSKTLVCDTLNHDNEEVLVFAQNKIPKLHGKGLMHTPLCDGYTCLGEATGILLIEPAQHAMYQAANDWLIKYSSAKTRIEHEEVTQLMMNRSLMDAVVFSGTDHLFMECDTPEEYEILLNSLFPLIKKTILTLAG